MADISCFNCIKKDKEIIELGNKLNSMIYLARKASDQNLIMKDIIVNMKEELKTLKSKVTVH